MSRAVLHQAKAIRRTVFNAGPAPETSDLGAAQEPQEPDTIVVPYDEARKLWDKRQEERARKHPELAGNYSMKLSEDLDALTLEPFFLAEDRCPVFSTYKDKRYIGAGGYGVVLSAKFAGKIHAVKFQRLVRDDVANPRAAPYVELRLLQLVRELTGHWPREPYVPRNVVMLEDWVRCKINVRRLWQELPEKDQQRATKFMDNGNFLYQILILEYAIGGSLENFMTQGDEFLDRIFEPKMFQSLFVQVFATLRTLSRKFKFTMHDCKLGNILLHPNQNTIQYLRYSIGGDMEDFYVPMSYSRGVIFQLIDFGIARADIPGIAGVVSSFGRSLTYIAAHNERSDTELFATTLLRTLVTYRGLEAARNVPPNVTRVLRKCMHHLDPQELEATKRLFGADFHLAWDLDRSMDNGMPDASGQARFDFLRDYTIVRLLLAYMAGEYKLTDIPEVAAAKTAYGDSHDAELTSRIIGRIVEALDNAYLKHRGAWIQQQRPEDRNCITEILLDSLFIPLRLQPSEAALLQGVHHANDFVFLPPGM